MHEYTHIHVLTYMQTYINRSTRQSTSYSTGSPHLGIVCLAPSHSPHPLPATKEHRVLFYRELYTHSVSSCATLHPHSVRPHGYLSVYMVL